MIRSRKGALEVTASHELALQDLARYFEISLDDLKLRICTPSHREREREIREHS